MYKFVYMFLVVFVKSEVPRYKTIEIFFSCRINVKLYTYYQVNT